MRSKLSAAKIGRLLLIISLSMLLLLSVSCDYSSFFDNLDGDSSSNELILTMIDIGQGDSIFVECGDSTLLIDAGPNSGEDDLLDFLDSRSIEKIDYVLVTHPHADHIGGMNKVIKNYEIGEFIMYKLPENLVPTSKAYEKMLKQLIDKNVTVKAANDMLGDSIPIGDAKLTILGPINDNTEELNDTSVVSRLDFGETSVMLSGDAEKAEEKDLIKSGVRLDADVYKVGHHGSDTSSCKKFLDEVDPEYAIISAGNDNSYNHPNVKTLDKLSERGITTYVTKENGNITVRSDGKNITVETEK